MFAVIAPLGLRVTLMALALGGCTRPKPPIPPVPVGSTAATGATGTTGHTGSADTSDTGADFVDPYLSIQPSVRLLGTPGMDLGAEGVAIVPAHGEDAGVLLLGSRAYEPLYFKSYMLSGDALGRGDKPMLSVWDGVSRADYSFQTAVAGDVNDDGHLDVWLGDELWTGPFLGRYLSYGTGIARIDGALVSFADIDADGDGNEDMVASADGGQVAWLFYGPSSGTIVPPFLPYPDPTTTQFSGTCGDAHDAFLLQDNLGPGHHAIAVGEVFAGTCAINTYVFDLMAPQASQLSVPDSIGSAFVNGYKWDGIGDIDGDGYGDAVYGERNTGLLLAGPMHNDAIRGTRHIEQIGGYVIHGIGDINGDGIEELLTLTEAPVTSDGEYHVLFSPHAPPIDVTDGVLIGSAAVFFPEFGETWGDLDGDGRSDLVDDTVIEEDRGAVRIWYGADLLAAEEARVAALPSTP